MIQYSPLRHSRCLSSRPERVSANGHGYGCTGQLQVERKDLAPAATASFSYKVVLRYTNLLACVAAHALLGLKEVQVELSADILENKVGAISMQGTTHDSTTSLFDLKSIRTVKTLEAQEIILNTERDCA